MKLASGGDSSQLSAESFLQQADDYHESEDIRDLILRVLIVETMNHPFAVARAGELRRWVSSGEYALVVSGTYPHREDDDKAKLSEETAAAAASYTDQFAKAEQTLDRAVKDIMNGIGDAFGTVGSRVSGMFRPRDEQQPRHSTPDDPEEPTPSW
jgi:hypothetical protein